MVFNWIAVTCSAERSLLDLLSFCCKILFLVDRVAVAVAVVFIDVVVVVVAVGIVVVLFIGYLAHIDTFIYSMPFTFA